MGNTCAPDCTEQFTCGDASFNVDSQRDRAYINMDFLAQASPDVISRLCKEGRSERVANKTASVALDSERAPAYSHAIFAQTSSTDLPRVGLRSQQQMSPGHSAHIKVSSSHDEAFRSEHAPVVTTPTTGGQSEAEMLDYSPSSKNLNLLPTRCVSKAFMQRLGDPEVSPEPTARLTEELVHESMSTQGAEYIAMTAQIGSPRLELVFEVDGEDRNVLVDRRPLGAEFAKRSNGLARVSKVHPDSYASELGLEAGWILKCVDGEDVTLKTFQEAQDAIKNGLMSRPWRRCLTRRCDDVK
jgi:hypothetical protein